MAHISVCLHLPAFLSVPVSLSLSLLYFTNSAADDLLGRWIALYFATYRLGPTYSACILHNDCSGGECCLSDDRPAIYRIAPTSFSLMLTRVRPSIINIAASTSSDNDQLTHGALGLLSCLDVGESSQATECNHPTVSDGDTVNVAPQCRRAHRGHCDDAQLNVSSGD